MLPLWVRANLGVMPTKGYSILSGSPGLKPLSLDTVLYHTQDTSLFLLERDLLFLQGVLSEYSNPHQLGSKLILVNIHDHQVVLMALSPLTLSHHLLLLAITLDWSFRLHLVLAQNYVGGPILMCPCVGILETRFLMSSSLLHQQNPACPCSSYLDGLYDGW